MIFEVKVLKVKKTVYNLYYNSYNAFYWNIINLFDFDSISFEHKFVCSKDYTIFKSVSNLNTLEIVAVEGSNLIS